MCLCKMVSGVLIDTNGTDYWYYSGSVLFNVFKISMFEVLANFGINLPCKVLSGGFMKFTSY